MLARREKTSCVMQLPTTTSSCCPSSPATRDGESVRSLLREHGQAPSSSLMVVHVVGCCAALESRRGPRAVTSQPSCSQKCSQKVHVFPRRFCTRGLCRHTFPASPGVGTPCSCFDSVVLGGSGFPPLRPCPVPTLSWVGRGSLPCLAECPAGNHFHAIRLHWQTACVSASPGNSVLHRQNQ
jgi:hypothetical protein